MQQADTAGSTRDTSASPGNFHGFSTLNLTLSLDMGAPILPKHMVASRVTKLCALDARIEGLKDFVGLAISSDDMDRFSKSILGHIWQSLDDMRVITSGIVSQGAAA